MRLEAAIQGNLEKIMKQELADATHGVSEGVRKATDGLKLMLRQQVHNAGMGKRLANTWRGKFYPNKGLDAAGLVYSKAPQIIRAFDEGVTIRAKNKRYLAIPSSEVSAMNKIRRRKITPENWPKTLGNLNFVPRKSGTGAYLISIKTYKSKRRKAQRMLAFTLIPQVRLRKRFDIQQAERRIGALMPKLILQHYKTTPGSEG